MNAREEFAHLLKWREVFRERLLMESNRIQEAFTQRVLTEAHTLAPRRKTDSFSKAVTVIGQDYLGLLRAPYEQEVAVLAVQCRGALDAVKPLLDELADIAEVRHSLIPLCFQEVHITTYLSQGFGANTYAKGVAEQARMHLEFHGVQGEVVFEEGKFSVAYGSYQCLAYVESDLDIEILRTRTTLPLRDWIKACWKMGTNPRVYRPMLPMGLEEALKLDYFGNDKK